MTSGDGITAWSPRQEQLAALAQRQLFFVGGAPRSGTTWMQRMLDLHPDISCRGEGLFQQELAAPLEKLMAARRDALAAKNKELFRDAAGYALPTDDDAAFLLGTAILLALHRQCAARACHAVGEKTPENVFLFPRLKRLFPSAKFIDIARDPRDSLASAWHFWVRARVGDDRIEAKAGFLRAALPAVEEGLRRMAAYVRDYGEDCRVVTYETMLRSPEPVLARLFRLLGVADDAVIVRHCVEGASFARLTGGRARGEAQEGAFFRKGVAGDWASAFPPELADQIVARLGWAFRLFGWTP